MIIGAASHASLCPAGSLSLVTPLQTEGPSSPGTLPLPSQPRGGSVLCKSGSSRTGSQPLPRGGTPFRAVTRGPRNRVLIDQEACSPPCPVIVLLLSSTVCCPLPRHTPQHGRRHCLQAALVLQCTPVSELGVPRLPVLDDRRRAQGPERQTSLPLLNQVSCPNDRWA